ncbi:N-acyl-phosphatidylethanolamine-hydrolyzing phospholipase D-like isoform X2 [Gigantopelta aegis]|nr:N-acyl-phosphatidylethanolamine-hydrolyzing phospholipase D-like isoform X2 [Gigantopelta aegis]XP_041348339.1 N-acyl-phosphatidylethanolamine-hydrolyzing phospholipase D-like isoform X2 [Gigantopelta aegis]
MATSNVLDKPAEIGSHEGVTDSVSNEEDEKTSAIVTNGRYINPWTTWPSDHMTLKNVLKFRWQRQRSNLPHVEELDTTLPVLTPDFSEFSSPSSSAIRCTWIGHATLLVEIDGVTILTDPVFSSHCSPLPFVGPTRYRPPACTVSDLPALDAVIISHSHYDHLDASSVRDLNRRFGKQLHWYVPMGLKKWMLDAGCENCVEMMWWNEILLSEETSVKMVCLPCQHWSGRSMMDTNKTLWCSWAVLGPKNRFYFAGDTGYCEGFPQVGRHYGPFTLAAIPIGNYKPSWFLSPQHVSPAEAVQIHHDVRSQTSIGIHWGTFCMMSYEHYLEPKQDLEKAVESSDMKGTSFICLKHGEVRTFGDQSPLPAAN